MRASSIEAGRLIAIDELQAEGDGTGSENVHPYVSRIVAFCGRLREAGGLRTGDTEKRAALKREAQTGKMSGPPAAGTDCRKPCGRRIRSRSPR